MAKGASKHPKLASAFGATASVLEYGNASSDEAAKTVCFKNQMTDFLYCVPIYSRRS